MSLLSDLRKVEALAKEQGLSVASLLAWIAQNAYGADTRLMTPTSDVDVDATTLDELREHMSRLSDAVAALIAEAEQQRTQLASITAYVQGVPELGATAVSQALASVQTVDEAAIASAVDAARQTISDSTDAALAAIAANTAPLQTQPINAGPETTDLEPASPAPAEPPSDPTPSPQTTDAGAGETTSPQPSTDQPA